MSDTPQIEPKEKHVPVISQAGENKVLVKVGAVAHPMLPEHWIQWIELYKNGELVKRYDLKSDDEPQAVFDVQYESLDQLLAKEHCNIHGTWQSDKGEPMINE